MTPPRISIVIPTYNQASFLKAALQSVLEQTMTDWEAIVINNHSIDDTIAVTNACSDPRISRIDIHNHGIIAASRNQGIAAARATWIAFLDSDDLWHREKLERCLSLADDQTDLISHPETIVRDGKQLGITPKGTPRRTQYRQLLFQGNCLSPTAVVVRKQSIEAAGGFCEDSELATAEDYDLWLTLARAGARCRFLDEPLSQFTRHEGSASASILKHKKANMAVLERHFSELTPRRPLDTLRMRRSRAMISYGAGRAFHKAGLKSESLSELKECFMTFPLIPKVYAALALSITSTGDTANVAMERFLWIWVLLITAAYLYQFHHLIQPVLATLGLV